MKVALIIIGGLIGFLTGAVAGFGVAMLIASPRYDGGFGMLEVLICVPTGAVIGLIGGAVFAAFMG